QSVRVLEAMGGPKAKWVTEAKALGHDVLAVHAEDVDRQGRWPLESMSALAKSGLLGLTVPSSYGGAGQGAKTCVAVTRILAENCASTAMIYLMHICAAQVMGAASSFPLREIILREVAASRHLSTLAFSEKGSRSHFWAPVSQVSEDRNHHKLNAQKSFVTSAGRADSYIVSTRNVSAKELTDSTLYFVTKDCPGLSLSGSWNGLGLRGNASAPMRLENAAVPLSHRITPDGQGFSLMMSAVLPWFQLG